MKTLKACNTLSEAMGKQPKAFDNLYVNMVKAGEAGGAAGSDFAAAGGVQKRRLSR
ncbi:MAG: hypothetical protein R3C17_17255 [Planctomycetaceae bacterium]